MCPYGSGFSQWRHCGHIDVPKQWNGSHVGAPNQSLGVELFPYVNTSFVPINLHGCWPREWKRSITLLILYNEEHRGLQYSANERWTGLLSANHNQVIFVAIHSFTLCEALIFVLVLLHHAKLLRKLLRHAIEHSMPFDMIMCKSCRCTRLNKGTGRKR